MLVDTHAHLNFSDFQKDIDKVVKKSLKAGVKKIICVSSNLTDGQKAIEIGRQFPGIVYVAAGIHPQQTDPENKTPLKKQIKVLAKLAQEKEVVAIGECGLDYSPAPPGEKDRTQEEQFFLFIKQIDIARKNNLPLLIHTRQAFKDTIKVLKEAQKSNNLHGVFHCYSAGKKGINQVNELGFSFGVDGNLTYDEGTQNVFRLIPLAKILLETDAPYLSPHPLRGQRNEPANIKIIAEFLAKLKGESLKKITKQTTANALGLFRID